MAIKTLFPVIFDQCSSIVKSLTNPVCLLRYRMAGITESAMVAYTHKYAVV